MSFSNSNLNIRPALLPIEMALRELHIEQTEDFIQGEEEEEDDYSEFLLVSNNNNNIIYDHRRQERILAPRVGSMENSINEHMNISVPSLDEIVIRQRGRQKKKPAKISWSPIKSPFKTPTKNNRTQSPSPGKKFFLNSSLNGSSSMILRNSPRKRIFAEPETDPSSSSTPYSTPIKRLRFADERSINAQNPEVPLKTLLKGLSHDQLIEIICSVGSKDLNIEKEIRGNLPMPDIKPLEQELCTLRKYITKSSPRSRLSMNSKTDGPTYTRALPHITTFKK